MLALLLSCSMTPKRLVAVTPVKLIKALSQYKALQQSQLEMCVYTYPTNEKISYLLYYRWKLTHVQKAKKIFQVLLASNILVHIITYR